MTPNAVKSNYNVLSKKLGHHKGLTIGHLNVRSLKNKIDQIRLMLQDQPLDVFAVSETWLNTNISDSEVAIPNYKLYRKDRATRGGGVALYVNSLIDHELCTDHTGVSNTEVIWVKISPKYHKALHVAAVYRPPSADETYFEHLLDNFEKVMTGDKDVVILGDFNFDFVLNEGLSSNPAHYIEELLNCTQLVHEPTRVTANSSTTIDLIYSSIADKHKYTGVIKCTLSDHYLIYTTLEFGKSKEKAPHKVVNTRSYTKFNTFDYLNDLLNLELYNIVNEHDSVDACWNAWKTQITHVMDKHAPSRRHRVRNRVNPWITKEIVTLMYKRDRLHNEAIKTGRNDLFNEYRCARNEVVKKIKLAKKEYYSHELSNNTGPRQKWKTLRTLLGTNAKDSNFPSTLTPNVMNDYFATVGQKLSTKFSDSTSPSWPSGDSIHVFNFNPVSEDFVHKQLRSLSDKSNVDVLNLDARLLREGADILVSSLTAIINKSLETGIVPPDWKRARVTPIYKDKGKKSESCNYRPISVISHIAKIMEKCVHIQLCDYLADHAFLSKDQSAYLKNRSTQTALHKVVDDLLDNINEGEINAMCFFDLSKCFDTIDHHILLQKLAKYGIQNAELTWFAHYLSNRTQAVTLNGVLSDFNEVNTGVPQGSILGPVLFLLFMNDLPCCLRNTSANLFADDTEIHASGKSIHDVQVSLQADVNNVINWFKGNKLTVNLDKCCCMLVSTNKKLCNEVLTITIDGKPIKQVNNTKYLGVVLDNQLTWNDQIEQVCRKLAPKVGLLRRLKYTLSKDLLTTVYKSIVQPHIDYCLAIWGHTTDCNTKRIQRLQNRAARIITGTYDRSVRGVELVKQLGWQNVHERRNYFTCLTVFKSLNGLSPSYMEDMFTPMSTSSTVNTRSTHTRDLHVPKPNLEIFKKINGLCWLIPMERSATPNQMCNFTLWF
jgi:hypothetical protein